MEKLTKYEKRLTDICLWGMLAAFIIGSDFASAHEGYHAPREPRRTSLYRAPISARLPPGGEYEPRPRDQRGWRGDYYSHRETRQPTKQDIKSMILQILQDQDQ